MHLPHTPVLLHAHALRKQNGLPRTDSWPAYAYGCVLIFLCMQTVSAADPFYIQDIKMSLWPDGVLVIERSVFVQNVILPLEVLL